MNPTAANNPKAAHADFNSDQPPLFAKLPAECLSKVFEYFDLRDRLAAEKVCRWWWHVSTSAGLKPGRLKIRMKKRYRFCSLQTSRSRRSVSFRLHRTSLFPLNSILKRYGQHLKSIVLWGLKEGPRDKSDAMQSGDWSKLNMLMKIIGEYCPHLEALSFVKVNVSEAAMLPLLERRSGQNLPSLCFHRSHVEKSLIRKLIGSHVNYWPPYGFCQEPCLHGCDLYFERQTISVLTFPDRRYVRDLCDLVGYLGPDHISIELQFKVGRFLSDADRANIVHLLAGSVARFHGLSVQFRCTDRREVQDTLRNLDVITKVGCFHSLSRIALRGDGSTVDDLGLSAIIQWMSGQESVKELCLGGLRDVSQFCQLATLPQLEKLALLNASRLTSLNLSCLLQLARNIRQVYLFHCKHVRPDDLLQVLANCKNLLAFEARECGRFTNAFFASLVLMDFKDSCLGFLQFSKCAEVSSAVLLRMQYKFAHVTYSPGYSCTVVIKDDDEGNEEWMRTKTIAPPAVGCAVCGRSL